MHGQGATGDGNSTAQKRSAKLTQQQAIEIYTSAEHALVLAERYNVTVGSIRQIKIGQSWRSATISLPASLAQRTWTKRRKLTDAKLIIVQDRTLTREHVMTQLNLTFNEVEYWRGRDPIPRPTIRERLSDEQWRIACDRAITIMSAAEQLGVSPGCIKTIRRKAIKAVKSE
jgi:hypothetical protein